MSEDTEETGPVFVPRRFTYYAGYVVVFGMLICFAIATIQFLQWMVPTWNTSGMVFVCALAAVEAVASHRLIKELHSAEQQIIFYRITEWLILLVCLKLYTELILGPANFWNNFRLWPVSFPENIFNSRMWLTIIPFAIIWGVANLFDDDLILLGDFQQTLEEEGIRTTTVRNLILRRFLNVGLFLVIFAGIPPQVVISGPQPPASNVIPAVVMYFVLGIILISLTRYNYLSTLWRLDRVEIPTIIPRRWLIYTSVLIVSLGSLIFLLPAKAGMGLMATLSALLNLVYQFVGILYALLFVVVNFFSRLLFRTPNRVLPEPIIPAATPPPAGLPASPTSSTWNLIVSIVFWGALAALILVALRQYILFNKDLADELKKFRPWRWLVLFWKRITASVKKANRSVGIFVQSSLSRIRNLGRSPENLNEWDYINPRRLNTRQKIIFYYLALLRRADEAGLPRREGQTPYEYAQSLAPNLAEGKEAVDVLTGSFVEARYSRHAIPREEAGRVETLWEAVRRILKTVRRKKKEKANLEK